MDTAFKFKQFTIQQNKSAMKVGTDGVLLGAWAAVDVVESVLDVGTGTGLIALMIAQRNGNAQIKAIEIDNEAFEEAKANFEHSLWASRLSIVLENVNFFDEKNFDVVISNPPFFVDSHKTQLFARDAARHDDSLSFDQLMQFMLKSKSKKLVVIYPYDRLEDIKMTLQEVGWGIAKICYVYPTPEKACHRVMLEIIENPSSTVEEKLVVEESGRHKYSQEYIHLTKEFYLKM